jgi:hypothetical protein
MIDNTLEAEIIAEFEEQHIVYRKKQIPVWSENILLMFSN